MIRTLIVDDEVLGRRRIAQLLEGEADIDIVGLCANGQEAVEAIEAARPDLVFLDVQMPLLDGFEVLKTVSVSPWPVIIFVTAYDQYAIRAFEVHALDYLLKPFDRARFAEALHHARQHLRRRAAAPLEARLRSLLAQIPPASPAYPKRLVIRDGGRVQFVAVAQVDWIEAAGNYAALHAGGKTYLHRETMSNLEAELDPAQFVRIHRSTIVNIDRIAEMKPWFRGEYLVCLRDGTERATSRSYRAGLERLLGKAL